MTRLKRFLVFCAKHPMVKGVGFAFGILAGFGVVGAVSYFFGPAGGIMTIAVALVSMFITQLWTDFKKAEREEAERVARQLLQEETDIKGYATNIAAQMATHQIQVAQLQKYAASIMKPPSP